MRGAFLLNPAAIWTLTALLLSNAGNQEPDIQALTPDEPLQRHIVPGDEQRFHVHLTSGEFASIVVEQQGIDVAVFVRDDEGKSLADFQDEVRQDGDEHVEIVAVKSGTYVLAIESADGATAPGNYVIRMAAPREATDADRRMQQSRALRTRARQLQRTGQFAEARTLLEQSLAIAESLRGSDDTYVAMVQFDLAGNALETQDNVRSRELYERAIRTFDKTWGASHPYPAMARSRLALLDERAGQRLKAEAAVRDILPLLERSMGPAHPWYLQSLVTFANLRESAGDLQQAEQIDRDALAAIESTRQTGTLLEATLLNNLADILRTKHDNAHAEPLFKKSLAIGESLLGADSLFVATALQNLGIMARDRKDYTTALSCYRRALSIRERLLGPDHPSLAGVLTNLANVYRATGEDQKALDTHFRALGMWEKTVGPYGRETLLVVGNIARTYAGTATSTTHWRSSVAPTPFSKPQMGLYVATGSERQKLAFVRDASRSARTERFPCT